MSSDYFLFEKFVRMLGKAAHFDIRTHTFVFVIGNHELWSFPGRPLEEIVAKYRKLLEGHGMYLLSNDLLSIRYGGGMEFVPYEFLMHSDSVAIAGKLRNSRAVVFGGTAFSGCNAEFNADDGIYRDTLTREAEIEETRKFEYLYNKLVSVLQRENTIILTHTPKKDWSYDKNYHDGFVYVSGHSHRNVFFDDGLERVYADNQIGYKNENPHLKSFWIDGKYDYFKDYPDGIHDISAQEYRDFALGKNIQMTYNRKGKIRMLKKNGYYCFLYVTASGGFSILNGGALKGLARKDIQYYYENMDAVIDCINKL